jgi:hypothetical protein
MSEDNLKLLSEFRSAVAEPDDATARRIHALATTSQPQRTRAHRRKVGLLVAVAAAVIVGSAVAAVTILGQAAPKSVQANIHRSAVTLFAGHPGLVKATARVVAQSPDATLYGISDRQGNYCVELVGASKGLLWSFSCDRGLYVGGRYATSGLAGSNVASITVAGVEPPVVWWGRLTSGTTRAQAVYPDGTTEQISLGSNGFFVYQPSPQNQARARRMPMSIQFLRGDGSFALSTDVLPQQPLTVRGDASETISGRALFAGAAKIQIKRWGAGQHTPRTRYVPIRPDGTFTVRAQRGELSDMYIVDRHNRKLTDYLEPLPEMYWRSLIAEARAKPEAPHRSAAMTSWKVDKSKPIHWTDIQSLSEGGRLIYRATNIRVVGDRFAVTASVTNSSPNRIGIHSLSGLDAPGMVRPLSFGLAYREAANPNITTRRFINIRATTFAPQLPQFLDPGQAWKGTFSGSSPLLRKHNTWWIVYGLFDPGGYWISDKSFST